MKLSSIEIDVEKLEQGAWIGDLPEMGDLRLRVRGIGNSDYEKLQTTLLAAVPRQKRRRDGGIDPDENRRIQGTLLLNTVLLDWDGVTDENDAPVPYSKEEAKRLLLDRRFEKFRTAVLIAASLVAEDRGEATQDILGNS